MWHKKIENNVEDWFYHEFQKRSDALITPQFPVPVGRSPYRLDFMVQSTQMALGVEVDGKAYHDSVKDSGRDRLILDNHKWIDAIVRFEAQDLHFNAPLATIFLCNHFPGVVFRVKDPKSEFSIHSLSESMGNLEKAVEWRQELVDDNGIMKGNTSKDSEYKEFDNTKLAVYHSNKYVKQQGVQNIDLTDHWRQHNYDCYVFKIHFMTGEKQREFQRAEEEASSNPEYEYNYDTGAYDVKYPDPMNYTFEKSSTVKVMRQ